MRVAKQLGDQSDVAHRFVGDLVRRTVVKASLIAMNSAASNASRLAISVSAISVSA
jgi:hypothetical protein